MAKIFNFVPIDMHKDSKNREKPVIVTYPNGKTCRFPSIQDASRLMNIPSSNIVACLKGRIKTAGGYQWKYADDFCSYGERRTDNA